jgi:hypothetical protein
MKFVLAIIVFLLIPTIGWTIVWKGKTVDYESKRPLQGVVIKNLSTNHSVHTDGEGNFDIEGSEGDAILFSCPGYKSEKHVILKGIIGIRLTFNMKMAATELKEVVVRHRFKTQYQNDSAERHEEHARILARNKSSVASPFSFAAEKFSRKQRSLFRFQKEFHKMEDQQFIDTRYTPELVHSLTALGGDTLAYFMNLYPMDVEYARNASPLELKMWIKYNYRSFIKSTDSLRQMKIPY